jgi:hypothetical protein
MYGLTHIVLKHWATSGFETTSKFLAGTGIKELQGLISEALTYAVAPEFKRNAWELTVNVGRVIGTSPAGDLATSLRLVWNNAGEVITMYPL